MESQCYYTVGLGGNNMFYLFASSLSTNSSKNAKKMKSPWLKTVFFYMFFKGRREEGLGCQHHFPFYVWYF